MDGKPKESANFKVGDQVVRTHWNNGGGAQIGQMATVRMVDLSDRTPMLFVEYDGCLADHDGLEGWHCEFAALSQQPEAKP